MKNTIVLLIMLVVVPAYAQRQPGRRGLSMPYPYAPATGWPLDSGVRYTLEVIPVPVSQASLNPRVNSIGILQVHLWRMRNWEWCDTETVQGLQIEQKLALSHFRPKDYIMLEQWTGYRFVLRGYDVAGKKVSEVYAISGSGPTAHSQYSVPLNCSELGLSIPNGMDDPLIDPLYYFGLWADDTHSVEQ